MGTEAKGMGAIRQRQLRGLNFIEVNTPFRRELIFPL